MISVTVTIVKKINVTAVIKGVIGLTFSGIQDDPINGNSITLLDITV